MSVTLVIRGLLGLSAAMYLFRSSTLSWEDYFGVLARYLIADGLVAGIIAATLLRESVSRQRGREMGLGIVTLIDAAGRALSGTAIVLWPGIAGFPLSALAFVAIMATCTAGVGLAEAWLTTREEIERHGAHHQPPQFMAGPVGIAAMVSIAFGIGSISRLGSPDDMRVMIDWFVAAAAAVAFAMAWSHQRMKRQRGARV